MEPKHIVVIADYGVGDPAFTEVLLQLKKLLPTIDIIPQSTPPFSTLNTGFWIYQLAFTENITNTYIYSNTAPRKTDKNAQKNNKGEQLLYAKLTNGFEILAVNAGYVFSFVKPHIKEFYFANVENEGSQFRSRDKFPIGVYRMVTGDKQLLKEKADLGNIPEYPNNAIASIDGYGNMKTTTRLSQIQLKPGQRVTITLNNQKHIATYTDGFFNIKEGELAFAPGSSGHKDPFMEITLRGGSAYDLFGKPSVEELFKTTI
jgi:hypothetical protein